MTKEMWNEMSSYQRELYVKINRTLLSESNIVRQKEEHTNMYLFIVRDEQIQKSLTENFEYMGMELFVNRDLGYIHLEENKKYQGKTTRYSMSQFQSMILCCLIHIYMSKMMIDKNMNGIYITSGDIRTTMETFKISYNDKYKPFNDALKLFKKFNLIDFNGDISRANDFAIRLYPSLMDSLDKDAMRNFVEDKIMTYLDDDDIDTDVGDEENIEETGKDEEE